MANKKARKGARNATRRTTAKKRRPTNGDLIISKSRTKNAASLNVSVEFYQALDDAVRAMIAGAEERAASNNRRTLRPHDL